MKRNLIIVSLVILIFVMAPSVIEGLFPNQRANAIEKYFQGFEDRGYLSTSKLRIYDAQNWADGELVAVENHQMAGIVYMKKNFGFYRVVEHALCNKNDEAKSDYMPEDDYQYRLLRVKEFIENKDIIFAYIPDPDIESLHFEDDFEELVFDISDNRHIVFSETNKLYSIIKPQGKESETLFVEWKDERLQDMMKYDMNNLLLKSDIDLKIAVFGHFKFNTSDNISMHSIELWEAFETNSKDYDALVINSEITSEELDNLVEKDWNLCIMDPHKNLKNPRSSIDEDTIIIEKSKRGGGYSNKGDFYDLDTSYYSSLSYIFHRLAERK